MAYWYSQQLLLQLLSINVALWKLVHSRRRAHDQHSKAVAQVLAFALQGPSLSVARFGVGVGCTRSGLAGGKGDFVGCGA